ncbi:hypothetical protein Bpfe_021739 [Biomphalaria pfeifferi]|uniref:Uncharacterized protein n=1 Tax=Biomphalaria pfeifferi TaxID=112525 RepID=A0AAD8B6C9_BIOPF|nr:hypothetical protein Bpfe_021739 [Biomphalaria pfeifferi]
MIPTKKFYKSKEVLELIDNDFNCESAPTAIVSVDTINLPSSDMSSEDVNNFIVSSLLAVEVNFGEWLSEAATIDPVETVENVLDKGLDGEAVMDTDEPTEEKGSEDEVDSIGVNHKNGSEQTATAKRKIAKKGFSDPSKWKRNAKALKRMNGEGRCLKPVKCTCCVQKLDDSLRTELFEQYWLVSWERKRDFILSNTVVTETSRKTAGEKSRRKQSIQYFLPNISGKVKVCQKMFLDTLDIGTKFLQEVHQKYLTRGHTQMEAGSVHAAIETNSSKIEVYTSTEWETVIKTARRKNPYNVKTVDHQFWKKYPSLVTSIRPGKVVGDPIVTDICHLKYTKEGIFYTLSHGTPLRPLPLRPVRQPSMALKAKYKHSLPLTDAKIADLKSLCETVIPAYHRPFYNSLL